MLNNLILLQRKTVLKQVSHNFPSFYNRSFHSILVTDKHQPIQTSLGINKRINNSNYSNSHRTHLITKIAFGNTATSVRNAASLGGKTNLYNSAVILLKKNKILVGIGGAVFVLYFFGKLLLIVTGMVLGLVGFAVLTFKRIKRKLFTQLYENTVDILKTNQMVIEKEIGGAFTIPEFNKINIDVVKQVTSAGYPLQHAVMAFPAHGKNGFGLCKVSASEEIPDNRFEGPMMQQQQQSSSSNNNKPKDREFVIREVTLEYLGMDGQPRVLNIYANQRPNDENIDSYGVKHDNFRQNTNSNKNAGRPKGRIIDMDEIDNNDKK